MSHWEETLKRLLRRGKVFKAAVLDTETYQPLSILPHLPITSAEGEGLVKAATSCCPCTFRLTVGGATFTCFQKDDNTLLGCADDEVLVAVKTQGVVLVGMADSESPGSCLYEVTEFTKTLRKSEKKRSGVRKVVGSGC